MQNIYKYLYFCLPRLRFLKHAKGKEYLDFGCGNGILLRQNLLVRPDLNCFGIDVTDFAGKLPKSVTFDVYNGQTLPYEDESFDIITANHVLEHVNDPEAILLELKRVIKIAQGHIFLEMPNERSLWGKPRSRFAGTVHFNDDSTHIRPYSRKDLDKLCEVTGLKLTKFAISRNSLHLVLSPLLLICGVLFPKKPYFMFARNSIIGWSSYAIIQKCMNNHKLTE